MGDIAEGMIEGFFCQQCGCVIDGEEPGYPRFCEDCEVEYERRRNKKFKKNRRINQRRK